MNLWTVKLTSRVTSEYCRKFIVGKLSFRKRDSRFHSLPSESINFGFGSIGTLTVRR